MGLRKGDNRTIPNRKRFFEHAKAIVEKHTHKLEEVEEGKIARDTLDGGGPVHIYFVMTTAGLLRISVHDSDVMCQFEWPKENAGKLPLFTNPHSGKWNHHWLWEDPVEFLDSVFGCYLDKITLDGEEAEAALAAALERKAAELAAWRASIEGFVGDKQAASAG